jgi:peptidoglycan/LPS O-acetylase OafA/YrhL
MTLRATKPSSAHRFHLQDGLRGLAAILVVCYHAPGYMRLDFQGGFLAVDFFFCLSGFVMMHAYGARLRESMTLRDFLVVRVLRLWPLYLLGTLIEMARFPLARVRVTYAQHHLTATVFLVVCGLVGIPNLMRFVYAGSLYPFNLPCWSLAYEMLANIGFAASARKRLATPALAAICVLSFACLLFVALSHHTLDSGASIAGWRLALARVGFSFSTGALLFKLREGRNASFLASNLAAILLAAIFTVTFLVPVSKVHAPAYQFVCITLIFPAVVYCASRISVSGVLLATAVVLGDMSYPIYVLHEGLMPPIPQSAVALSAQHPHLVSLGGLVVIALVGFAGWVISRKFEIPLRRRLTERLNRNRILVA